MHAGLRAYFAPLFDKWSFKIELHDRWRTDLTHCSFRVFLSQTMELKWWKSGRKRLQNTERKVSLRTHQFRCFHTAKEKCPINHYTSFYQFFSAVLFQPVTTVVGFRRLGMDAGTRVGWEKSAYNPVLSQRKVLALSNTEITISCTTGKCEVWTFSAIWHENSSLEQKCLFSKAFWQKKISGGKTGGEAAPFLAKVALFSSATAPRNQIDPVKPLVLSPCHPYISPKA